MATQKYKRGSDGFFKTKVWDGTYNPDGSKHRKNLRSDKSSRDLERQVELFKRQVEERKQVKKSDASFLEYARIWKKVYKDCKEAATRNMYNNIIEKHLIALDGILLQNVDRIHLQMCLNNASGKPRTQQQISMAFFQILKSAVADHLFPENVYQEIKENTESIKHTAADKRPLTAYEKSAVFKANFELMDKIFVYLIYGCGLRREEALALTIFNFSFRSPDTVSIKNAHGFDGNDPYKKATKSKNGERIIPIPTSVSHEIKTYVNHCKSINQTHLFVMRDGKEMTKSSYDKMWNRILRRMQDVSSEQIVGLSAHVFRHNYCTNLCYQIPKVSIKKIAELMGDTEKMVLEVYNHIILEKEDATAAVNNAMNF